MAEPYSIQSEPVVSSSIAALGYDGERKILAVTFKGGDVFHYAGVDVELAVALYGAESIGTFYAQRIRGKFAGQKMTGRCPNCGDGPGRIGVPCESCGTAEYVEKPRQERRAS